MTISTPFAMLDGMVAPIIIAANKARQVRDALPETMWRLVPSALRDPIDALFWAVEQYDRKVGLLREAGLIEPKDLTPGQ